VSVETNKIVLEINAEEIKDRELENIERELQKDASSFQVDRTYPAIPMQDKNRHVYSYIIRGLLPKKEQLSKLMRAKAVRRVYQDASIGAFHF
jgi:flagellar biosynthesis regulator FlaF